jgi:hypothetical protein
VLAVVPEPAPERPAAAEVAKLAPASSAREGNTTRARNTTRAIVSFRIGGRP